jgi:hypothetical protein
MAFSTSPHYTRAVYTEMTSQCKGFQCEVEHASVENCTKHGCALQGLSALWKEGRKLVSASFPQHLWIRPEACYTCYMSLNITCYFHYGLLLSYIWHNELRMDYRNGTREGRGEKRTEERDRSHVDVGQCKLHRLESRWEKVYTECTLSAEWNSFTLHRWAKWNSFTLHRCTLVYTSVGSGKRH